MIFYAKSTPSAPLGLFGIRFWVRPWLQKEGGILEVGAWSDIIKTKIESIAQGSSAL